MGELPGEEKTVTHSHLCVGAALTWEIQHPSGVVRIQLYGGSDKAGVSMQRERGLGVERVLGYERVPHTVHPGWTPMLLDNRREVVSKKQFNIAQEIQLGQSNFSRRVVISIHRLPTTVRLRHSDQFGALARAQQINDEHIVVVNQWCSGRFFCPVNGRVKKRPVQLI
jgi:hypothetical protein